jgi:acetyl-CoA carboxylase carboxyl transferase subunit alpha
MNQSYLEFEKPIAELQGKIDALSSATDNVDIDVDDDLAKLRVKCDKLTESIFSKLDPWQVSQVARHPNRPFALDYIESIFTEFQELHGDRAYADDPAIVAGIGRLNGQAVAIIGQQKGRDTKEKIKRNFGMPKPEGYRKALRIMKLAEKFKLPLITLIDTPGAYPGVGAEERGQSEAIARNLITLADLKTPVICTVIGEGGSGGALAIGVGDRINMMQYSTYSVISPEGCASILWKSADKAPDAAEAMGITSDRLKELNLIDRIIPEPLGGAHRDPQAAAASLRESLIEDLSQLSSMMSEDLIEQRSARLRSFGEYKEA